MEENGIRYQFTMYERMAAGACGSSAGVRTPVSSKQMSHPTVAVAGGSPGDADAGVAGTGAGAAHSDAKAHDAAGARYTTPTPALLPAHVHEEMQYLDMIR